MTIVMKFGGTSVANAEAIRHCASLVRGYEHDRVVVVVSAMSGVTDLLIELARAAAAGTRMRVHTLLGKLHEQHELAARALGAGEAVSALLSQLDTLVAGIGAVNELTPRSHDAVVSFGERLSAVIVAAALAGHPMTGHEIGIVTDDRHTEANPLMKLSLHQIRQTLQPRLEQGEQLVVTGFIAATQHGALTGSLAMGGRGWARFILKPSRSRSIRHENQPEAPARECRLRRHQISCGLACDARMERWYPRGGPGRLRQSREDRSCRARRRCGWLWPLACCRSRRRPRSSSPARMRRRW